MESLWGFVIIVFLLVCVISTVYALFASSPYKRDNNTDFGEMDIETLKKLLKERLEYPYCKNISINEEGDIDLVCKYATYAVKIEDRKLVVNNKFRPFAKAGNIEEEKDCLEAHLVKIILPEADINTPRALGHFRRYLKARIISRISGWLFLILLILYLLNKEGIHITDMMDIWTSKGVSMMQFTEYSDEITIGEALRATCPAGKWSSNKIDKGLYRVAFDGYGMNGRLLTIVFQSKDWSECSILSVAIDGQDCSLLKGVVLEALFENAGNGDSGGISNEQGFLEGVGESISELDNVELMTEEESNWSDQQDEDGVEELYDSEVQGFTSEDENILNQSNRDIDYLGAYSSIIEDVAATYDEYCEYTLYDLDEDGINELITSEGTCDADWVNVVYTLEDDRFVTMIGQFYGSVMLYVAEDGNGLYAVSGGMEYQNIDQITKNGNQLQVETIMSGEIGVEEDYYSNDNPVNFISVTDDSLLRQ